MSALHRHHDKNDNNNNEYNNVIWTIRFCNKCAYFVNVRDEQYEQGILKIVDIVMMFIIIVYLGFFFFCICFRHKNKSTYMLPRT